jgi:hypothetical protein
MAADLITARGARFQSSHGKGMAEIHQGRAWRASLTRDASGLHYGMERFGHGRMRELATAAGDKQVGSVAGNPPPLLEVLFEGGPRRVMEWQQAAFLDRTGICILRLA